MSSRVKAVDPAWGVMAIRAFLRAWRFSYVLVTPWLLYLVSGARLALVGLVIAFGTKTLGIWRRHERRREFTAQSGSISAAWLLARYYWSWARAAHIAGLAREPDDYMSDLAWRWKLITSRDIWWRDLLAGYSLQVPRIVTSELVPLGVRLDIELFPGMLLADIEKAAPVLAETWQISEVRATQKRPGIISLVAVSRDPLKEPVFKEDDDEAFSLDAVPVGRCEDGTSWKLTLLGRSTVLGGLPGSGKSVFLRTLTSALSTYSSCVRLSGIDLKGGVELSEYADRFDGLETTQDGAVELLQRLVDEHKKRMTYMRENGYRSIKDFGPNEQWPLLVLVVDECAELFVAESTAKDDRDRVASIIRMTSLLARQGRATGISLILSTQKPTADSLPTVIRDACENKIAFRCATREQEVAILGAAANPADLSATSIRPDQRGVAIATTEDGTVKRVRGYGLVA